MLDSIIFAVLPYLALSVFLFGTIYRYVFQGFSYSSLSSQFLENRHHFWGIVPFHLGLIFVLVGHAVAFLIPRSILLWNQEPLRLYILETAALIGGLLAIVGLLNLMWRRLTHPRVRRVTTAMDWVVLSLLLVLILSGVLTAVLHRWGSSWFAGALSPYLWSVLEFNPKLGYVAGLPWLVKVHVLSAWVFFLLFPFTRLVHILVVPNPYLWRRPQVVLWNRSRDRHATKSTQD